MSELFDLNPDKPVEVLTPGQVALYLKAKNAEKPCEACGHDGWGMCPERDGAAAASRGLVWLACDQCNAVRTFLRPPVVAWLKESRGA